MRRRETYAWYLYLTLGTLNYSSHKAFNFLFFMIQSDVRVVVLWLNNYRIVMCGHSTVKTCFLNDVCAAVRAIYVWLRAVEQYKNLIHYKLCTVTLIFCNLFRLLKRNCLSPFACSTWFHNNLLGPHTSTVDGKAEMINRLHWFVYFSKSLMYLQRNIKTVTHKSGMLPQSSLLLLSLLISEHFSGNILAKLVRPSRPGFVERSLFISLSLGPSLLLQIGLQHFCTSSTRPTCLTPAKSLSYLAQGTGETPTYIGASWTPSHIL